MKDYCFAVGQKIKKVLVESELYLDGKEPRAAFESLGRRRIDTPLFLLLDNDTLLRLYASSLSVADRDTRDYVMGEDFCPNKRTSKEFEMLCGLSIVKVEEFYANLYDFTDDQGNLPDNFDVSHGELTNLVLVFDNGLRLLCFMVLDFFDMEVFQ